MVFESVRAYVQLASGLGDLTRARARKAAQGLFALPAAGMATGTKVASQASVVADELLAAAAANRSNLQSLLRSEVNAAITRAGLVPAHKLEEAQAEAAELREEVATLRSGSSKAAASKSTAPKSTTPKSTAPKSTAPESTAPESTAAPRSSAATKSTVKKTAPVPRTTTERAAEPKSVAKKTGTAHRSAVTTRARPVSP